MSLGSRVGWRNHPRTAWRTTTSQPGTARIQRRPTLAAKTDIRSATFAISGPPCLPHNHVREAAIRAAAATCLVGFGVRPDIPAEGSAVPHSNRLLGPVQRLRPEWPDVRRLW